MVETWCLDRQDIGLEKRLLERRVREEGFTDVIVQIVKYMRDIEYEGPKIETVAITV